MLKTFKVAGIGELLWDLLPQGKQLGGAPFNFAYHAHQAGCQSFVISALGIDSYGDEILSRFDDLGLDKSHVQRTSGFPTGTVTVALDDSGNPSYTIHENVAWDNITWKTPLEDLAKDLDAVCFGSLAQRNPVSRQTILQFLKATRNDCLKIFDINLRQIFYSKEIIVQSLELANILKLNEDELPEVANLLDLRGNENELTDRIMKDFNLKLIALTKGSKGSTLCTESKRSELKVLEVKIADTIGAGDSFTAILTAGLLQNISLERIHKTATDVAAFVCTQKGATPELPRNFVQF